MKEVLVLQEFREGKKDATTKIVEHPLEREVTESWETTEKIKEQVKDITQQYKDFKVKINIYTISSWCGSRESHKIVLGACW